MMVNVDDGRTVDISELGGLADIAHRFGWNHSTLTTWAERYEHAPKPVGKWRRGAVYVVEDWRGFKTNPLRHG